MKEKAIRIFQFLKELKNINTKIVWNLEEFDYGQIWISEIPISNKIKLAKFGQTDETGIWLEVKKQVLPKLAPPPIKCIQWLKDPNYKDPINEPALEEIIQIDDNENEIILIEDNPEIKQSFEKYLEYKWRPWAKKIIEVKPVYDLYNKLFEIFTSIKKEGEKIELVLGIGLITWSFNNQHIRKHLVTSIAQLDFDAVNGVIALKPSIEGTQTQFENEILSDVLQRDVINEVESDLKNVDNPWNLEEVRSILKKITNHLEKSEYNDSLHHKLPYKEKGAAPLKRQFKPPFCKKLTQNMDNSSTVLDVYDI